MIKNRWIIYLTIDLVVQEYSTEFHSISRKEKGKSVYVSSSSDGITLTAIQRNENAPPAATAGRNGAFTGAGGAPSQTGSNHVNDCRPTSSLVQR